MITGHELLVFGLWARLLGGPLLMSPRVTQLSNRDRPIGRPLSRIGCKGARRLCQITPEDRTAGAIVEGL